MSQSNPFAIVASAARATFAPFFTPAVATAFDTIFRGVAMTFIGIAIGAAVLGVVVLIWVRWSQSRESDSGSTAANPAEDLARKSDT